MHIPSALQAFLYKNYPHYQGLQLVKKGDNLFQADLYRFHNEKGEYLVKSYHRWTCFAWLSRHLIRRELHFYSCFQGYSFMLPLLCKSKDSLAFVVPWVHHTPIKRLCSEECAGVFFRARKVISTIHARKITHGDIRLKNFLYNGEHLYLIDWVTSVDWNRSLLRKMPAPLKRMFYRTDWYRLEKMFSKLLPRQVDFHPPWWYYPGAFFRKNIYRWFKKD